MDPELIAVCAVQVVVLAVVVTAIVVYLLRHLMFASRHDAAAKSVLITGCDSALGWQLARHYDRLGLKVYAGCVNTTGEGAVRLQAEASNRLELIAIDTTSISSVVAAMKTIRNQIRTPEKGTPLIHPVALTFSLLMFY